MKITTTKSLHPSTSIPPSRRESFVWSEIAPRLIDPTKLAIIEAFVQLRRPLTVNDLASILEISDDLVRYHFKALIQAGVLEVIEVQLRPDGGGEEHFFDFPPPPQESLPSPSAARP